MMFHGNDIIENENESLWLNSVNNIASLMDCGGDYESVASVIDFMSSIKIKNVKKNFKTRAISLYQLMLKAFKLYVKHKQQNFIHVFFSSSSTNDLLNIYYEDNVAMEFIVNILRLKKEDTETITFDVAKHISNYVIINNNDPYKQLKQSVENNPDVDCDLYKIFFDDEVFRRNICLHNRKHLQEILSHPSLNYEWLEVFTRFRYKEWSIFDIILELDPIPVPLFHYLFSVDQYEKLIIVDVDTAWAMIFSSPNKLLKVANLLGSNKCLWYDKLTTYIYNNFSYFLPNLELNLRLQTLDHLFKIRHFEILLEILSWSQVHGTFFHKVKKNPLVDRLILSHHTLKHIIVDPPFEEPVLENNIEAECYLLKLSEQLTFWWIGYMLGFPEDNQVFPPLTDFWRNFDGSLLIDSVLDLSIPIPIYITDSCDTVKLQIVPIHEYVDILINLFNQKILQEVICKIVMFLQSPLNKKVQNYCWPGEHVAIYTKMISEFVIQVYKTRRVKMQIS